MKKSFEKPIAELIILSSDEIMGTDDDVISGDIVDLPVLPDTQAEGIDNF